MIAEIFGYAIVIALLVGLAAASVEHLLTELRRPRRFAWLGAFFVAVGFPPLAWLLAPTPSAPLAIAASESAPRAFAAYAAIDWNAILVPAWIAATTILLILYAAAWLRLKWLAKRWPQASGEPSSVVVADDIGPAVLGILAPRIVLPRWLMDSPAAVRSTVLAHELEHIAARDQALIVAAHLVAIALPWNLPLWWFVRRLRAAIEVDCDARVLHRGIDPAQYADVLLAVGQRRTTSPLVAAALIEPVTQLERRIRIMLTTRRSVSFSRVSAAAILIVAVTACAARLEPPVIVADSIQAALDGSAVSFESHGPGGVRIMEGRDGRVTVLAGKILMQVAGPGEMRITSDLIIMNGEDAVFEGDVRIDSDGTSITAARARTTRNPQGEMALTVEDAKVIRTFAEPASPAE